VTLGVKLRMRPSYQSYWVRVRLGIRLGIWLGLGLGLGLRLGLGLDLRK